MKKIVILGSTGKIGSQALEVIRSYPKEFEIIGLACGHQSKEFENQIKEFRPKIVAIAEKDGQKGVVKTATHPEAELVVVAVVGLAGLKPTIAAIKAGKDIALATKEVLVIAGELVMKLLQKHKVNLVPLDSEHSAIFQSLKAGSQKEIKQVFLTMGKGPIAKMTKSQLIKVNIKDIFNRPCWSMGQKIGIDSASCMNKAFEVIEAKWLFNLKPEQIKILVHKEYLCHSLVEFIDGSIITELGSPDMRRYLQYALFYPVRKETKVSSLTNLVNKKITFESPPFEKFPCLELGYKVLKAGGTMPAVMHGADTTVVRAFVDGKIRFTDIPKIIVSTMKACRVIKEPTLGQLIKAEKWGQDYSQELIKKGLK
ncbi:1-deoxy-D-xylulose-5-phosphate reductoisomerase [Candidatus Beckwithbacteria bacterium CG10_big_fil_rev_8_21_14_0_10_34_10]|uniref:1-deoxy-D-xylulose 5-phosphate reductoisomerase n=1 Tax=Candidatus Beckwithbacteria bacterium CG10_big_fil_rev_8_21_14_0_10_34_10 TaxID=1974495 RepID=A0A2H0W9J1_9BACT|nr:MAG: 1-deoxy-D-xylulose-5-phosphate reductoisomerase [Candidatus Beckwithbacteria bacterium CG10_big_fil_rev_8_21_14_0_10_34_10]